MTRHLRFFEEAAAEIEHERAWYRHRSEVAEAGFLRELEHALQAVTDRPETWPSDRAGTRRSVFLKFPFSPVYFVEGDDIFIMSLAAEHRSPGYWRDRASDVTHPVAGNSQAQTANGRAAVHKRGLVRCDGKCENLVMAYSQGL